MIVAGQNRDVEQTATIAAATERATHEVPGGAKTEGESPADGQ